MNFRRYPQTRLCAVVLMSLGTLTLLFGLHFRRPAPTVAPPLPAPAAAWREVTKVAHYQLDLNAVERE